MDLFESARLRVERARIHAGEMTAAWNEYLEPHPFSFDLVRESDTTYLLRCEQHAALPELLSALFGEWLYNLRSALDYLVWAAAAYAAGCVPPPNEGGLQYPIYDDESAWERNRWRLKQLAPHQVEMLETMQPFRSDADANYLGWINRLARIDRHRRLTTFTARVAEANPVLAVPSGVHPNLEWGRRMFVGGQCDFARVIFPDRRAGEGVTYNPRIGIDPEIGEWGESPFWSRIRFSERIQMMMIFVRAEIDIYDFDCTGNPEARRTVTDTFAQESDLRRSQGVFPPVEFKEVVMPKWTPAVGHTSTAEKYRGADFPSHGSHAVNRR
ncbi:hypothetical protein BH10ACT5_BH10ACT5_14170 [soil metagenome]